MRFLQSRRFTPTRFSSSVTASVSHLIYYQGSLIFPPQLHLPGFWGARCCWVPRALFNVIVIGIEFQINQAQIFSNTLKLPFQHILKRLDSCRCLCLAWPCSPSSYHRHLKGWPWLPRKDSPTVKRNPCASVCFMWFSVFFEVQICVQVLPTGDVRERSGGCDSCSGRCHRQRVSCLNPDIWPRPDIVQSKVPPPHAAHIDGPPKNHSAAFIYRHVIDPLMHKSWQLKSGFCSSVLLFLFRPKTELLYIYIEDFINMHVLQNGFLWAVHCQTASWLLAGLARAAAEAFILTGRLGRSLYAEIGFNVVADQVFSPSSISSPFQVVVSALSLTALFSCSPSCAHRLKTHFLQWHLTSSSHFWIIPREALAVESPRLRLCLAERWKFWRCLHNSLDACDHFFSPAAIILLQIPRQLFTG